MPLKRLLIYCLVFILLITGCSKKHIPAADSSASTRRPDSAASKKVLIKKKDIPKIITVNDKVAKKAVDGRMYYDIDGHRYWKNYNDGKYYLFNQSMYTDSAFKPH